MRLRDSSSELQICPKCGRPTLLSEPSPHGQLVCLHCGIVPADPPPGAKRDDKDTL
jgi:hypothetical protein